VDVEAEAGAPQGGRLVVRHVLLDADGLEAGRGEKLFFAHEPKTLVLLQSVTAFVPFGVILRNADNVEILRELPHRGHRRVRMVVADSDLGDFNGLHFALLLMAFTPAFC
jgi:hypothetical protein